METVFWNKKTLIYLFKYSGYTPTIKAVSRNLSPLISVRADSELVIPVGVKKSLLRIKSTAVFQCTTQGKKNKSDTLISDEMKN